MSRGRWQLRDAALAYASRGIPVLPLHHPLPHRHDLQPVGGNHPPTSGAGCSCRDPGCGQGGKHPLGSLVPHGVTDATCNRARVLAWWTRHPQANIGLATGHAFDVLDVDGPEGAQAIQELAATHSLHSAGPLVRTGGGGWHYYLRPTGLGNATPHGLEHVDWRGRGGYVVAPPSRHASGHSYQWAAGRDLDTPPGQVPAVLFKRLQPQQRQRLTGPVQLPAAADGPGDRYARAALVEELARVAAAPVGQRNRQLWESTRNLYNLVAAGALDHRQVDQGLLAAAERCGLLGEEPRQTRRTLASGRQVGLARPRHLPTPERTEASPGSRPRGRSTRPPRRGGEGHGRRPAGWLTGPKGGRVPPPSRAHAHPDHPAGRSCMGSHPTLDQQQLAAEARQLDPDDWQHGPAVAHLAADHPQVRTRPDDNPDLAHHLDHRDWIYDHSHPSLERAAEQAFDRLNPTFGVPADRADCIGHRDVAQREAALALGVRVAVHDSRQNDRQPVIWQPSQDYRMADAIHAARTQPTRTRRGPERTGPER